MPKRKSTSTPHRKQQVKALARLRKLGLTTSRAPSGKRLSGGARAALKKFKPVLEGKATAVKAAPDVIRRYRSTFTTSQRHIIVPKREGERVLPLRGTATIRKTKQMFRGGRRFQMRVIPKIQSITDLPRGKDIAYAVHMGTSTAYFATYELLEEFINNYKGFVYNIGRIEVISRKAIEAEF